MCYAVFIYYLLSITYLLLIYLLFIPDHQFIRLLTLFIIFGDVFDLYSIFGRFLLTFWAFVGGGWVIQKQQFSLFQSKMGSH